MIKCKICDVWQDESQFPEIRRGGLAICNKCSKTPKAEQYRKKVKDKLKNTNLSQTRKEEERKYSEQVDKYSKW